MRINFYRQGQKFVVTWKVIGTSFCNQSIFSDRYAAEEFIIKLVKTRAI